MLLLPSPAHINPTLICYKIENRDGKIWWTDHHIYQILPSLQFLRTRNCIAPHQLLPPYYQPVEPSVRAEKLVNFQDFTAQTCLLKISNLCQQSLYHQTICLNCINCTKKTSESNCFLPKLLYPKKQRNRHPIHITLTAWKTSLEGVSFATLR